MNIKNIRGLHFRLFKKTKKGRKAILSVTSGIVLASAPQPQIDVPSEIASSIRHLK